MDDRRKRPGAAKTAVRAVWLGILAVAAFAGLDESGLQKTILPGVPLEFSFRALAPGEAILVKPLADPSIRRIDLRFRTQKRQVEFDGESRTILLGIDLSARAQAYFLEFTIERRDGSRESFFRKLSVGPREFPSTRLTVAPGMAKAPPEEAERIEREAALVASVLSVVSPEWLGTGPFTTPLPEGEPFPNFGQRRLYNNDVASVHSGVDISAPAGTPARAANSGRVVLAANLYYSGNTVIIDHGLGVFTYYGHFSKILVKRGQPVKKGEVIAKVGSTGRSTGPHLHWSVRVLDSRVDPFSLAALPLE